MARRTVDINADVGEGLDDESLMPFLTSVSIACGGHAGDEASMRRALTAAVRHGLHAGAHPSYPDLANFGRAELAMPLDALASTVRDQLTALSLIAAEVGIGLTHFKAHGALYNRAWRDPAVAKVLAGVVADLDPAIAMFAPPGSVQEATARAGGLRVVREVFLDRRYGADGALVSRGSSTAMLDSPVALPEQLSKLAALEFETMCVHGDNPAALELLRAMPALMADRGWQAAAYDTGG